MRIIFSAPDWAISGVNSFNHNLMRGLRAAGHEVELVLNRGGPPGAAELPLPEDVIVRELAFDRSRGFYAGRWAAFIEHLNRAAPCIYVPGYDFDHSCVAPALDDGVGVIGVVHSDDPYHYEHLIRLGRYWNATIAVSSFLLRRVCELEPLVAPTAWKISCGVPCPAVPPPRAAHPGPLRIVYTGRFDEVQKRVSDLPRIAHALARRGVPAEWTLIGGGTEDKALRAAFASLPAPGRATFTGSLPPDEVLRRCAGQDCFVLTSNFEGLPVSLLEAMAQGTIPVVTDIESGIPDVVHQGENGFRCPVGDIEAFAGCLAALQADPARRTALSAAAFATVAEGGYSMEAVTARYLEVFESVLRTIAEGRYRRPPLYRPESRTGRVLPPPRLQFSPDTTINPVATLRANPRLSGLLGLAVRVRRRVRRFVRA